MTSKRGSRTTTNPKPRAATPDPAQTASDDRAGNAPVRYYDEPLHSVRVVVPSVLIDRAAQAFCPDVGNDAPAWATRAAQMVLFSILPMRLRSEAECAPPPLPDSILKMLRGLAAKIAAKHGARRLPSSSASCTNLAGEAPRSRIPGWDAGQLVPPAWVLKLERNASEDYRNGFHCGRVSGAVALLPSEITKGAEGLVEYERQEAAQLPSERAADFFAGLRDGENQMRGMPERARQMAQRTKIFQVIAVSWKEVVPGKLNSTGELYEWLCARKAITRPGSGNALYHKLTGSKVVGEKGGEGTGGTDSREVRKVCRVIGLRHSDQ